MASTADDWRARSLMNGAIKTGLGPGDHQLQLPNDLNFDQSVLPHSQNQLSVNENEVVIDRIIKIVTKSRSKDQYAD